ncbi:MAG: LL-diaminopimelate aminotransferase [Deltaproteobacteria bacterium]|nr:LL-diaminopimelate aminotransferase [Deltaproteobacteria bacterium]
MTVFEKAERLKNLPPYLFKELDRKRTELRARGMDIIDLGVGDPDLPTPDHIVEAMKDAVEDPDNHRYPSYSGMNELKDAVSKYFDRRFGVQISAETEVLSLIGSKEGLAHFPLAFVDPGDVVLIPTPAYPVYHHATLFAGGESFFMPLKKENNFLPDLEAIPSKVTQHAKMMFLNYPNNPTSAVADHGFFERVVRFAEKHSILVCHDAAYTEMAFDGYRPLSFLEVDGAKEVGIEFHSLSKTYNMTGWRIGFAVGNQALIEGLGAIKSNMDSGVFQAIQIAGIKALTHDQSCVKEMVEVYTRRRDLMVNGLKRIGFEVESPKATFYLWIEIPRGYTSAQFTTKLLEKGVVVAPGNGFGEPGEGYVRISLSQKSSRLEEAIHRMKSITF